MEPEIYFVTTRNCNLKCRHCYLEAGPGRESSTISNRNFERMLKNLPDERVDLSLSGGEIFSVKNQPYEFLNIIKYENKFRDRDKKIHPHIQSNGFWAKDLESTRKVLDNLRNYGVFSLDISSNDKYHREQGFFLNENLFEDLVYKEEFFNRGFKGEYGLMGVTVRGCDSGDSGYIPFPIGRAEKNFDEDEKKSFSFFHNKGCKDFLKKPRISVDNNGEVYNCCFQVFSLGRNLIEDSLENIINKAKNNERLRKMDERGIKGLAKVDGFKNKNVEKGIKKSGICGFCYKNYVKYPKK